MEFQAGRVNKTGEPKLASGLVFDKQQSPAISCLALKLGFLERNVVEIRSAKRNESRINTSSSKSGPVPLYTQQRKREKTSRNR